MAKKSDYRDPRTNLYELLPEVLQSQTNEAVFENVFNRYLSKPQLELVDGFAGQPIRNTTFNRQIQEPTPHRQAFQLQPLLYAKVGNVNHLASYVDILNEIRRYGVDDCRLPLWGNALQFNWAPPIDVDKLVNFRDYYWVDTDDPTSDPQYITIESPCIAATQRVDAYQETVDTYGDLQTITGLSSANQTVSIAGDLTDVFTEGFVFLVTGSTNITINTTFFTTTSSTYDLDLDTTTIVVDEVVGDDSTVDGSITLENYLTILQSQQQCACGSDVGWDFAPWDDNQVGAVLWSSNLLATISQDTEAEWLAAVTAAGAGAGSPIVVGSPNGPIDLAIWYDTTTNQLKQYFGGVWNVVHNNFAAIVALVQGIYFWDYTSTCDVESNQWSDQNKWYHKNHVPNFSIAKQATLPIIEYDFGTQLNQWTFTDYVWQYRESDAFSFVATTVRPSLNELIPFNYVINSVGLASPILNQITLSPEHGDQTNVFIPGYQFDIELDSLDANNNGTYTVSSSNYITTNTTPGDELATVIVVEESFSSANQSESSIGSPATVGSGGQMTPRLTSLGDNFLAYNEHWLLDDSTPGVEPATGELLPVPSPPPTINPFAEINPLSIPRQIFGVGEYLTSTPVDLRVGYGTAPYVLTMEYSVLPAVAPGGVPAGTPIPLDPRMITRAPKGESVVRVVYNGQQIYGTFTELDSGIAGSPPYFVGSPAVVASPLQGVNDGFVDSITLAFDLEEFDTLLITVAEQSVEDIGRSAVPVRTIADDTAFNGTGSPLGSQPEIVSLIQYREVDQLKTATNQYPLFDVFDCEGNALNITSELFKWQTDQTKTLNPNIGLRIVGTTTRDYGFENLLIDSDTLPRPVLYTYKTNAITRTVWRKGLNNEQYVPEYVDRDNNAVTYGDPAGAWEVPDQLYFNAEHENRQFVTFPDIISHFRSILTAQQDFPGVILPGSQSYLHPELNFGLGGRIKEFNDSYDTFLSSVFVNNVSPPTIIDFAHDQYEGSLNTIKELYRRNLITYLTDTSTGSILDFQATVNEAVLTQYELNDFFSIVYGDSNTFIAGSPRVGVQNWPATLPFVGLAFKEQPHVIQDDELGLLQLIHHDGHRSNPSIAAATRESVIQTLLNTNDSRQTGQKFGTQQSIAPPDTFVELSTYLTPLPGIYWYSVIGSTRTLYRFSVVAVAATPPSNVPVGSLWYDTADNQLKELQPDLTTWSPVVGSPDGIITSAWEEIDFNEVLVDLLLDIEQRLYEAAPTHTTLDFDIGSVQTTEISCPSADTSVTEADTASIYYEEAFSNFLRDIGVTDPYSAAQFYVATDAFTWNYSLSSFGTGPRLGSPTGAIQGGWWTQIYQRFYGTPYPHREPWALQGYSNKPSWWDGEYLNDDPITYGMRRWKYIHGNGSPLPAGMWEEIRQGRVPAGQTLPDGTISTGATGEVSQWNYFSVNIDDSTIDGFEPDALFPPFWDFTANGGSAVIRSIFEDFATEIILPSADYTFETGGPIKFLWEVSSQQLYDDLLVGFRMQPVRFIHSTFGVNFIEVDGLQVNEADCKVYSHRDVMFHGDIVNTNQVFKVDGVNQWYVNYNRFNGYDVAASDFRQLWAGWEPLLTYQFGSVIDTQTLQISNSNFGITERDYQIILKRSPGIADYSLDAFNVTILESPNRLAQYDTQSEWKFLVDTFFPITRSLSYYEVHDYPVRVDVGLNTLNLYQFNIVDVDIDGIFFLSGDQTSAFTSSQTFTVAGSTANNGTYTASNVSFNASTNRTAVVVAQTLSAVGDGYVTTTYRTHPWATGDKIELTSSRTAPAPLSLNKEYFVIKINDFTFQLASTLADAIAGRNIILSSAGAGQIHAGQVFSKFTALDGGGTDRVWNHYVIDTRFTRSIIPPQRVTGVQNLINIVDGYAVVVSEDGWVVNLDNLEQDPDSGQPISWAIEVERFIDKAYRLPRSRAAVPDTYPVSVNSVADTFVFNNDAPVWQTGTKVSFSAGTGTLPAPLLSNQTYYLIRVDDTTVQVALTASNAALGVPVDIISGGSATVSMLETPTAATRNPAIEINPFRNNVWLNTPQGILSNVVDGPTDDIRNTQLITDQRSEQLRGEDISVLRWDKLSRIFVPSIIPNPDVAKKDVTSYNFVHMASMQAFVDGYESIIVFNDAAVDGTLIYDPFVGLNTARFFLQFFRQDEFTQRPVVGGYFLTDDDQILRNIESNVLDLQNLYDTNKVLETTPSIKEGRRTLGYQATAQTFLDQIGLNPKSKFLFWKGMIQNKGSVEAINAFTNSVRFEDSDVDEYWAYKVANFGSNYELEYPALNLFIEDSQRNEKRFEFLTSTQTTNEADSTFEGILLSDQTRWFNQPDVLQTLADNNTSFYFEAEITNVQDFTSATAGAGSPSLFYYESTVPFDDVLILEVSGDTLISTLSQGTDYNIINSRLIEFTSDPMSWSTLRLYTFNVAEDKSNPSKVIDVKRNVVVSELPMWDPRKGHQYAIANNVVNIESPIDPASYTNSLDLTRVDAEFWNRPETNKVWWDTAQRGYYPYNDSAIFGLDDRIQNWGKLEDWAEIKLYQWTKSDIPPAEWDAQAAIEELDISIDPLIRKTGRAKVETFQRERTTINVVEVNPSTTNTGSPQFPVNVIVVDDSSSILSLGDRIVFTTDDELPLPLESGVFYYIISLDNTTPALTELTISEEEEGDVLDIKPGAVTIELNVDASIPGGSTGLINDFDTAGIQSVTFTTTKNLGSTTGLNQGTKGFQDVDFGGAVSGATATGLNVGSSGSQTISWTGGGSPVEICSAATGLSVSTLYGITVQIDGGSSINVYFYGAGAVTTYDTLATTINTAISATGSAVCVTGTGIVVSSDTTGPSSTVSISDGAASASGLVAALGGTIDAAIPGTSAPDYEATVNINGGTQTLDINGADAQTFTELLAQINGQLTGIIANLVGGDLRITSNERGTSSTISITDVDLFSAMGGTIQAAVPGTSTIYQTNIAVDGGGQQTALISGDEAQTFATLIDAINLNLTGATVLLISGNLRFVSSSTGSNSTIDIIDGGFGSPILPGLLESLSNVEAFTGTAGVDRRPTTAPVDGVDATRYTTEIDVENGPRLITIIGNEAQTWNQLLTVFNDQLPSGVLSNVLGSPGGNNLLLDAGNSTVTITNDSLFTRLGESTMGSPDSENGVYFGQFVPRDTGDGNHVVVPPFADDAWVQLEPVTKTLYSARDNNGSDQFDVTVALGSPVTTENSILGPGDDTVDVYVNGSLILSDVTIPDSGLITISGTNPQDIITIRKERHVVTDEQAEFEPDVFDDGTNLIQYKNDYNYSQTSIVDEDGDQATRYYFWVENKTTRQNNNPPMRQAVVDLETIPTPYTIVDNLQDELFINSPEEFGAPRRYTQLILRGLAGVVDDSDRYVLRFTRDFTLRDELKTRNYTTDLTADLDRVGAEPLDLKSSHAEWTLIREKQPFNIPRGLWNKVTESIVGRLLDDAGSRVPTIAREVYDLTYDTQTRYGLGTGQAFVDGELALATLIDDLQDPNNDFSPIDINTFFATHDFETEQGLIDVMEDVYNTFTFEAVNRIWFKILLDAFTTKQKYPDIFKTSWVALSGTQVFETEELFTG